MKNWNACLAHNPNHFNPRVSIFSHMIPIEMGEIDLRPYGLGMTLRKGLTIDYMSAIHVNRGSFSQTNKLFSLTSGDYQQGSLLGKGSYGESFEVKHVGTDAVSVIKVIHIRADIYREDVMNLVKECIIHIILEKTSEGQTNGPFVPRFHEVALDVSRGLMLIRMEKIFGTLADVYESATPKQNELYVPDTLKQLASIIGFFAKTLKFNHRDMKSNNVMYVLGDGGRMFVKLIDFGFTCLTWQGVKIQGSSYFSATDRCYLPSRDLTQFVYEVHMSYQKYLTQGTREFLEGLMTFPIREGAGTKMCALYRGCSKGRRRIKRWLDVYDFLNMPSVSNPHCVPEELVRLCEQHMGHKISPTLPAVVGTPVDSETKFCPPEKVLNPRTRRCVRRDGALGRRIMAASKRRSHTPKTRRYRVATGALKPCRPGQERNPATRRCRKRVSAVRITRRRTCPADKILNPRTHRCVKRDGAIGKALNEK